MADKVIFEDGDDLSEVNMGQAFYHPNIVDYVVWGVSSSIDFGNNTVDYTEGEVIVTNSNNVAYRQDADARSGLSLTDSATNHVFVEYDPTTDDSITFTINTTGSTPTDPNIKIEEIDTAADTSTEFNRNPDVGVDAFTSSPDLDGNDLTDDGTTVYDASTDTIGDGTTSADHSSINNTRIVRSGGEFSTIQSAHDDLPSSGGVIILSTSVSETNPTLTKPVTLIGGGMVWPDSSVMPPDIYLDHSGGNGLDVQADGANVYALTVQGDGSNGDYGIRAAGRGQEIHATSYQSGGVGWLLSDGQPVQNSYYSIMVGSPTTHPAHIDVTSGGYFNANTIFARQLNNGTGNGLYMNGAATGNDIKGNTILGFTSEGVGGDGINSDDHTAHVDNMIYGYGVESQGGTAVDISTDNEWLLRDSLGGRNHPSSISGDSGTRYDLIDVILGDFDAQMPFEATTGASTSATTVLTNLTFGGTITVVGQRQDGAGSTTFVDTVSAVRNGSTNEINKNGRASADTRSYSMSGGDLQLTMGGNTYNVLASGPDLDPQ